MGLDRLDFWSGKPGFKHRGGTDRRMDGQMENGNWRKLPLQGRCPKSVI